MEDGEVLIGVWSQRGKTEMRARLRTFNGARYFDLRLFAANADGQKVPTPKGVSLPVRHLDDLLEAAREARRLVAGDGETT